MKTSCYLRLQPSLALAFLATVGSMFAPTPTQGDDIAYERFCTSTASTSAAAASYGSSGAKLT